MDAEKQKFLMREYGRLWEDAGVESVGAWIPALASALARGQRPEVVPVRPRPATLDELRQDLASRCSVCASSRPVFGAGDPKSVLMFVGDRPSEEEQASGIPFLGPAGLLLGKIIEAMGFRREQTYLTTLYKCRAGEEQTAGCADVVVDQIALVRPRLIVALGEAATEALTGRSDHFSGMRGTFHPFKADAAIDVMATFPPAHLLAEPSAKRLVWDDMKLVMNRLQSSGREETTS